MWKTSEQQTRPLLVILCNFLSKCVSPTLPAIHPLAVETTLCLQGMGSGQVSILCKNTEFWGRLGVPTLTDPGEKLGLCSNSVASNRDRCRLMASDVPWMRSAGA